MKITELEDIMKSNAEELKNSIQVPGDVIKTIQEREEGVKKKCAYFKNAGFSLAAVAAVFVLLVNFVPSLAYASHNIPVLGSIVKVVTFGRYEVNKDGIDANIVTPQIEGLLNEELENKLNTAFKEHSLSIIAAFEKDVKELEKEYGKDFHLGVDANYVVRTDNENILAIDTYIVNTVGSSSTKHSFYNINKKTGELIEFKDLFKENADYVTPISAYIKSEMQKANDDGTAYFWIADESSIDGFKNIKENQNFFINDAGNIVICFDKYDVAPGGYGSPEFEIPQSVLKDIVK